MVIHPMRSNNRELLATLDLNPRALCKEMTCEFAAAGKDAAAPASAAGEWIP